MDRMKRVIPLSDLEKVSDEEARMLYEIDEFGILFLNDAFLSTLNFDDAPLVVDDDYWTYVSIMHTQLDGDE